MNYQEFIIYMQSELASKLSPEIEVRLQKITKNNGVVYDGLCIIEPKLNISPMLYLMPFYHRYLEGSSIHELSSEMLNLYERNLPKSNFDVDEFIDFKKVKEKIIYRLVNYEKNKEQLALLPHRKYLDLAVIFYCQLSATDCEQYNILIHHDHLKLWNISEDTLFGLASANTPQLLPPLFSDMASIVLSTLGYQAFSADDLLFPMYILSNKYHTNGAAVILYEDFLNQLSNQFHTDFILLPSSIHEMIAIPYKEEYASVDFSEMVTQVNETELTDEEVLSNNVYYYDSQTRKLNIVKGLNSIR